MPHDTNLFIGVYSRLLPPPYRAHSYIQTAQGDWEGGSSKGERRTADDRVIKAELHLPHRAGRRATDHPSRLLLMTSASKNLRLLSHSVRICVIATVLVTRLKRRRCNRFRRRTALYAVWTGLQDHQQRHVCSNDCPTSFAQRTACWPPRVIQFNDYLMRKTDYKYYAFFSLDVLYALLLPDLYFW